MKPKSFVAAIALFITALQLNAAEPLAAGVRGVATHAPKGMKIDGDLSEFKDAMCTPLEYFNDDLKNRAVQFFYMWDDEAFYAAMRTLDTKPANNADDNHLWEGDAVEWYFDTPGEEHFRDTNWGPGAVHCYWTGLKGTNVEPRFCLRPGYLDAIKKIGVEVGAKRTAVGMDVEFKLPWANFPKFKAKVGEVISLDAEACYSDGAGRVFRSFAFGSPLSVQQPANQGKIQLVEKLEPSYWEACGPVMAPIHCDTAWTQKHRPMVTGFMALPPNQDDLIGRVIFRVVGLHGETLGEYPAKIDVFQRDGNFQRASAQWPNDLAVPGAHQLLGIIYDKSNNELTRVAPRMVSVNMTKGY